MVPEWIHLREETSLKPADSNRKGGIRIDTAFFYHMLSFIHVVFILTD